MPNGVGFYELDATAGVAPAVVIVGRLGIRLTTRCSFRGSVGMLRFRFVSPKGFGGG